MCDLDGCAISSKVDICPGCGSSNFVISHDYFYVCADCGLVDNSFLPLVHETYWSDDMGCRDFRQIPESMSTKGRYKPIFHWNERIAQMCLDLPPMDPDILDRIKTEASSGQYGTVEELGPPEIVRMLRKLGLIKYRERWKWILHQLNREYDMVVPDGYLIDRVEVIYKEVESQFWKQKCDMVPSSAKVSGKTITRNRHNIIPFNYLFRKIMESMDVWDYHWELPLLRSSGKLYALDNIMMVISKNMGLKFSRTPIIKWPKIKKKVKKC